MPLYEYECARCGPFTHLRAMAGRAEPADCPECGGVGARVLSAPHVGRASRPRRRARDPVLVRREPPPAPASPRPHASGRPWMLGH